MPFKIAKMLYQGSPPGSSIRNLQLKWLLSQQGRHPTRYCQVNSARNLTAKLEQIVSRGYASVRSQNSTQSRLNLTTPNDAQFAPLQPHIPMSVVGLTAAQRNDIHVVTDQEAVLVAAFGMRTKACRDAYLRQMNSVLPSVASMIASAYSQNEASLADLIQKKVSWGDYVKRVEATYNALKPQLMTELQRIGDELDKENPVQ